MTLDPSQPDPHELERLHATAFDMPWTAKSFADLLETPGVFALVEPEGFILMRVVADEAEVLTLAVNPSARRQGLGLRLLKEALARVIALGAIEVFLEVAVSNTAAIGLYRKVGFQETGRRRAYYELKDGGREDALVLSLNLTQ